MQENEKSDVAAFHFSLPRFSFLSLFDERDFVDLPQRGLSLLDLQQRRLAKEGHPLLVRGLLDLRSGTAIENHGPNTIGEVEKFRDRGPAVKAGAVALQAARSLVEGRAAEIGRIEPR